MGYRSNVALLLYGTPDKVNLVDSMLLQKLSPEYDRPYFERCKQVKDETLKGGVRRFILWTFSDVKWYSEMDEYKDALFDWVYQIMEEQPDHERNYTLAYEFMRLGENDDDNEVAYSDHSDLLLTLVRKIDLPNNFEWRN